MEEIHLSEIPSEEEITKLKGFDILIVGDSAKIKGRLLSVLQQHEAEGKRVGFIINGTENTKEMQNHENISASLKHIGIIGVGVGAEAELAVVFAHHMKPGSIIVGVDAPQRKSFEETLLEDAQKKINELVLQVRSYDEITDTHIDHLRKPHKDKYVANYHAHQKPKTSKGYKQGRR
jgi:hypothetical protein